ncbi:hypothetical protein GALMADRAFT_210854 [Galerina marginata CBS 339.88]|uniref:ZZ-type domain-containing protein n=1 Tax=Galerina marginata (strain CBS 339.88) TaxID=685588 RepID=A0A067T8F3_GALM3|nr:hypothetical protein GALMADRAFT_210854 [Galerina marginata CBS 339.88]
MSITFACYFPAEKSLFIPIRIRSDAWVMQLVDAIETELNGLGQVVSRKDLRLFKTDVSLEPEETLQSRALQWLHEQPADSQIKVMTKIGLAFPNGPHQSDDDLRLDIIVADAEVLDMVDGLGDPYYAYRKKVKNALNKCLNNRLSLPSPSDLVKDPRMLKKVFGGEEPDLHVGRPGGAPAAIFNPVLASLQQSFSDLEQVNVSEDEALRAANYIRSAAKFYDWEDLRQEAIKELVDAAIAQPGAWGRPVNMAPVNDIIPNACWWHDIFLILILELKNSLGLSGDALFQAVVDYIKMVSCDQYKPFREYCNFPMVLIGATANRLEISIAVCVGPIYVTKLLTLDLSLGFRASDNVIQLARVFKVLSRHRVELQSYYQNVKNSASPRLSCLFPNPTPIDPSKALPKLTYRQFLSRSGQPTPDFVDLGGCTTAMYIATLDDTNQEVIVKFTARYNEAAHRLLAEAKLAPKLYFCGRVVGDLYMIVMERVDGTSIWQLQQDKTPIPEIVLTKVEEAVGLLHQQDIVFGDLRPNNILYVPAPESHAVLVDFDWPGRDGEGKYPATLNRGADNKTWHNEVLAYGVMHKNHDLWQLEQLKVLSLKTFKFDAGSLFATIAYQMALALKSQTRASLNKTQLLPIIHSPHQVIFVNLAQAEFRWRFTKQCRFENVCPQADDYPPSHIEFPYNHTTILLSQGNRAKMATAGLFSMDFKETGYTMVIPDDDLARLMYYLHCVTVGVGLDVLQDDLVDFRNYNRLSQARITLVLKYAIEFSPDEFLNKLIFLDDEGEVVTGASPNKFVTISTACDIVSVQSNILIAGKVKDVTKVMFFKSSWLELYYTGPIARALLDSRHCAHCKGASGMCQCELCPRPSDANCQPLLDALIDALNSTTLSTPAQPAAPARTTTSHECVCDGCRKQYPEGARYRCEDCEDFDLCQDCYTAQRHDLTHRFMQIARPGSKPFHLYPRSPSRTGAPPPIPISRQPAMNPLATPTKSLNSHACNCDACGWQFIEGARYKCEVCADFDLCKECYVAKRHNLSHRFMQIDRPGSVPIHLSARALHVPAPAPAMPTRSRSPAPPPPPRSPAPPPRAVPPPRQRSPAPATRTAAPAPPPNPPSYATAMSHTATPDFYNTMKVTELKDFLKEHGVAYEDILDKETLCRRAWEAHCDSMSVSELNIYLANNNISTHDCRDIASRRDKAKQAFQSTPPPPPPTSSRKEDPAQFRDGDIVMLTGLSRAEMNGKQATVVQADCGGGRAEVNVEDLGRTFKVKHENLLPVSVEDEDDFLD